MDSTCVHVDVVTNQSKKDKEPKKKFVSVEGEGDWSTGPYACFPDFPSWASAAFSAWCPRFHRDLESGCTSRFFLYRAVVMSSERVRTMGGIKGTACDDCIMICFCGACAAWQMQRELDEMGIPKA